MPWLDLVYLDGVFVAGMVNAKSSGASRCMLSVRDRVSHKGDLWGIEACHGGGALEYSHLYVQRP